MSRPARIFLRILTVPAFLFMTVDAFLIAERIWP